MLHKWEKWEIVFSWVNPLRFEYCLLVQRKLSLSSLTKAMPFIPFHSHLTKKYSFCNERFWWRLQVRKLHTNEFFFQYHYSFFPPELFIFLFFCLIVLPTMLLRNLCVVWGEWFGKKILSISRLQLVVNLSSF